MIVWQRAQPQITTLHGVIECDKKGPYIEEDGEYGICFTLPEGVTFDIGTPVFFTIYDQDGLFIEDQHDKVISVWHDEV